MQSEDRFWDTTFGQLRTLSAVRKAGNVRTAAHDLVKDQSSVDKQLNALRRNLGSVTNGDPLWYKPVQGRGVVHFTPMGELICKLADQVLAAYDESKREVERSAGKLVVASTTFMLSLVCKVLPMWRSSIGPNISLSMRYVRTADVPHILLEDPSIDFCFAGHLVRSRKEKVGSDLQYIEYSHDEIGLLTNLDETRLSATIDASVLRSRDLPFLLPRHGMIWDFARAIYGGEERLLSMIVHEIENVFFGVGLLQYGAITGCMFTTQAIAEWARHSQQSAMPALRFVRITGQPNDLNLSVGLFRRSNLDEYGPDHPLTACWNKFAQIAEENERNNV